MKRILSIVAAVVVVAIAGVLIVAATKPDEFRVARSTVIDARPEAILAEIADFHRWQAWSPYETKDPAMARSFGGAARGKGATYQWEGTAMSARGGWRSSRPRRTRP
jgi:hypothetical protein